MMWRPTENEPATGRTISRISRRPPPSLSGRVTYHSRINETTLPPTSRSRRTRLPHLWTAHTGSSEHPRRASRCASSLTGRHATGTRPGVVRGSAALSSTLRTRCPPQSSTPTSTSSKTQGAPASCVSRRSGNKKFRRSSATRRHDMACRPTTPRPGATPLGTDAPGTAPCSAEPHRARTMAGRRDMAVAGPIEGGPDIPAAAEAHMTSSARSGAYIGVHGAAGC
ncbi:hypothetical protein VTO73DRAFT_14105 [Trametes versicolor]